MEDKKKVVVNTSEDETHPEWLFGGNPDAIEAQEVRGQKQFVESEVLPVHMMTKGDKGILEAAGVEFGNRVKDDPIFCYAKLPEGWKKQATDHPMWSELVDGEGKVRARIFYKAAFYDRHAHLAVMKTEG